MSDDGKAEAIATTGLFLNFVAVIAIAVCLASWGGSHAAMAALSGVVAVISFAASIACFRAQADDHDQQEVPVG
jgi:F0F1-type ATP synthase assembly protein I